MNIDQKDMTQFIEEVSYSLSDLKTNSTFLLDNIPLSKKECIYVIDFVNNKVIYNKGFQNLLGFKDDDITLDIVFNNYHPDDKEVVNRLIKAAINYSIENAPVDLNNVLYISYRRRKKDGSYIKVLSKNIIHEVDDEGRVTKGYTKLLDISFMDNCNAVKWVFEAESLNEEDFKRHIYQEYEDFFTKREREIIEEIANGLINKSIAEKFHISEYTVATHRKHILKKSNCHNTNDLILFCRRKGIL